MLIAKQKNKGFTIVELLIVIVVIAILAAISIVAYTGIQNRARDTAVKNDISNIAKKVKLFHAEFGYYPWTDAHFSTMQLSVSKDAYDHFDNGASTFNLVYCPNTSSEPSQFAIVAYGKSGNNFMYTAGGALEGFPLGKVGSIQACGAAGVTMQNGSDRYWFYDYGAWRPYL